MKLDAEILIVGAGPVGLTAAAACSAVGLNAIVIETQTSAPQDLRASTFHPPTLEMLDDLGFAEPLIAAGLVSPTWQIRLHETGERALFDLALLRDDTRFPYRLQCEQRILCSIIAKSIATDVEVRRGVAVRSVEQSDDSVCALLDDGSRVRGRYLIGADGGRSAVREAVGIKFDGTTYPETTILATTRFPFHDHLEGLSNVNYCWSDYGTFSLLRLPDAWRCSLYADPGEGEAEAVTPSSIKTKLGRIVPSTGPHLVDEIRPYRIHQRIAADYRAGRVFLAGDAAHLNSPSGGMGMNGGIHDAINLVGKLGRVLHHSTNENLLDLYARERKPIAQDHIIAGSHRNRTRMQERDPVARRAELARLQAITADPVQARAHLLRSSMIEGLRQAGPGE